MSASVKMLGGRQNVTKRDGAETLREGESFLRKREEFLRKQIEQELLFAKKSCRTNRAAALQALRRKKWYEKHLKCVDCAVKAVRFASEYMDVVNKVNDLIEDITKRPDVAQDFFYTSADVGVELDEEELLAELERLEMNPDELLLQGKTKKEAPCVQVLPVSPASPEKTEEDEVEDGLEYLRWWANETS